MDTQKPGNPGPSRRGLLKCMAWAGTGIVWTVSGGVPRGLGLGGEAFGAPMDGFTFVQISDTSASTRPRTRTPSAPCRRRSARSKRCQRSPRS